MKMGEACFTGGKERGRRVGERRVGMRQRWMLREEREEGRREGWGRERGREGEGGREGGKESWGAMNESYKGAKTVLQNELTCWRLIYNYVKIFYAQIHHECVYIQVSLLIKVQYRSRDHGPICTRI